LVFSNIFYDHGVFFYKKDHFDGIYI